MSMIHWFLVNVLGGLVAGIVIFMVFSPMFVLQTKGLEFEFAYPLTESLTTSINLVSSWKEDSIIEFNLTQDNCQIEINGKTLTSTVVSEGEETSHTMFLFKEPLGEKSISCSVGTKKIIEIEKIGDGVKIEVIS